MKRQSLSDLYAKIDNAISDEENEEDVVSSTESDSDTDDSSSSSESEEEDEEGEYDEDDLFVRELAAALEDDGKYNIFINRVKKEGEGERKEAENLRKDQDRVFAIVKKNIAERSNNELKKEVEYLDESDIENDFHFEMNRFYRRNDSLPHFHFDIIRGADEKRIWSEPEMVKSFRLCNERDMSILSIEHFEPRFKQVRKRFRIQTVPFSEGGVRYAFKVEDVEEGKYYVGKCFKMKSDEPKKRIVEFVRNQIVAKHLAKEFNKALTEKTDVKEQLQYVGMDWIALFEMEVEVGGGKKEKRFIPMTLEEYIEDSEDYRYQYQKFDNIFNCGEHPLCQAFSHFTSFVSGGFLVVVGLEGVCREEESQYLLTNPCIFQIQVREVCGEQEFLLHHKCNSICRKLGLCGHNYQELKKVGEMREIKRRRIVLTSSSSSSEESDSSEYEEGEENDDGNKKKQEKMEEEEATRKRKEEQRAEEERRQKKIEEEEKMKKREEELLKMQQVRRMPEEKEKKVKKKKARKKDEDETRKRMIEMLKDTNVKDYISQMKDEEERKRRRKEKKRKWKERKLKKKKRKEKRKQKQELACDLGMFDFNIDINTLDELEMSPSEDKGKKKKKKKAENNRIGENLQYKEIYPLECEPPRLLKSNDEVSEELGPHPRPSKISLSSKKEEKMVKELDDLKKICHQLKTSLETVILEKEELENRMNEKVNHLENRASLWESQASQSKKELEVRENRIRHLEGSLESMRKGYLDHYEDYHTVKYELSSISCYSDEIQQQEQENEPNSFVCLEGAKGEFEVMFSVAKKKKRKDLIDFKDIRVSMNGRPIQEVNTMPASVEFDLQFPKLGRNELVVDFKNVKKTYFISVSSREISQKKSEILLRQKNEKVRSTSELKFQVSNEIDVIIVFRNKEGFGLPFRCFSEMNLSLLVTPLGSKRAVHKAIVHLEESCCEGGGKLLGYSFQMEKSGRFVIKLLEMGGDFFLEKKFEVL